MNISDSVVSFTAETFYNLLPSEHNIRQLAGYSDKNFVLVDSLDETRKFVLKIVNEEDSDEELTSIIDEILINGVEYLDALGDNSLIKMPKLVRTASDKTSVTCHINVNDNEQRRCNVKLFQFIEDAKTLDESLVEWQSKYADGKMRLLFEHLGAICYQLNRFLRTQQHLKNRLKEVRIGQQFPWQVISCRDNLIQLRDQFFPSRLTSSSPLSLHNRQLVDDVLSEYYEHLQPELEKVPEFVLHGDLNIKNIMVERHQDLTTMSRPYWIIDFQDAQVGPRVIDLAIMMLYAILETANLESQRVAIERIPSDILRGYQSSGRDVLSGRELALIPGLMRFRLCQSMLNGLRAFELDPDNRALLSTNLNGWSLLKLLFECDAQLSHSLLKQQQQQQHSYQR